MKSKLASIIIALITAAMATLFIPGIFCQDSLRDQYKSVEEQRREILISLTQIGPQGDTFKVQEKGDSLTLKPTKISPSEEKSNVRKKEVYAIRLYRKWHDYSFKVKVPKTGKVYLRLNGTSLQVNGMRNNDYPASFEALTIDGVEQELPSLITMACGKSYVLPAKGGTIIDISIKGRVTPCSFLEKMELCKVDLYFVALFYLISAFIVYKLIQMCLKRSRVEGGVSTCKSSDSLLVLTFFIAIAVPMFFADDVKVLTSERRNAAVMPDLINAYQLNREFGKQFDDWSRDHFFIRQKLIPEYNSFICKLNKVPNIGGNIFDKDQHIVLVGKSMIPESPTPSDCAIREMMDGVVQLHDICSKKGIDFYVLVVPAREDFLWQKVRWLKRRANTNQKYLDKLLTLPYVVCPREELEEAGKTDYTYFLTDHHWTQYGAYIGYRALMEKLIAKHPEIPVADLSAFDVTRDKRVFTYFDGVWTTGQTFTDMRVDYPIMDEVTATYGYYTPRRPVKMVKKVTDISRTKHYMDNPRGKGKAMLVGVSMCDNLLTFLPESFNDLYHIRLNGNKAVPESKAMNFMERHGNELDSYKPDVFILCVTSANIPSLRKLCK